MTVTHELQVPNKILIAEVKRALAEGHSATFRVKGKSMRLFLDDGRDIVKIEKTEPQNIKVRDVALAEIEPDHYVLHRVIKREGHRLTLMGDGNLWGTESCNDTEVVGIATAFYRKGRKKPDLATGRKWRTYSSIWLAIKPMRRIILGICRRLPFNI